MQRQVHLGCLPARWNPAAVCSLCLPAGPWRRCVRCLLSRCLRSDTGVVSAAAVWDEVLRSSLPQFGGRDEILAMGSTLFSPARASGVCMSAPLCATCCARCIVLPSRDRARLAVPPERRSYNLRGSYNGQDCCRAQTELLESADNTHSIAAELRLNCRRALQYSPDWSGPEWAPG